MLTCVVVALAGAAPAGAASSIRHVFVIVLENESASTTFGPNSPAPYLSKTLVAQGGYIPNFYGIGHNSNDNYIAMISGQAPNPQTQADCQTFGDFSAAAMDSNGQELGSGCVYPSNVPTIASQLNGAGLTWRDYNEDMGANPARESATCGHPVPGSPDGTEQATPSDQYATRHNPFVYFHGIIDNASLCDANVVNLSRLPQDLASVASTPNYVFISPNLCDDGHDAPCVTGAPGGLAQADTFLRTWVPRITASPAYRQDGLLLVTFDEAAGGQSSACCGEIPGPAAPLPGVTGPGGGQVGAVALSPCVAPGTVTQTAYNHYGMLRSVEDMFGLPHMAYASLSGQSSFGSDLLNSSCGPNPPVASISAPPLLSAVSSTPAVPLSWRADTSGGTPLATFTVQGRDLSVANALWTTLQALTQTPSATFPGKLGHTYQFQVQATNMAGQTSPCVMATTLIPTGARPSGSHFSHGWKLHRASGAWNGRAIVARKKGATATWRFSGTSLSLLAQTGRHRGTARLTIDGRRHTVHFHAAHRSAKRIVFAIRLRPGQHRLTLRVLRGIVALEGFAVSPG